MTMWLLLALGAFLAAAISGTAGFGGALLLLPALTLAVGPVQAVPLLTFAQLIGNGGRVGLGWRQISWRPVLLFLITALPAAIIGALFFVALPKGILTRVIGCAILGFVALRHFGLLKPHGGNALLLGGGAATGLLSGLVGSAGPLGAAIFLSLDLTPLAYIASEATTALAMHLVKSVIYGRALTPGVDFIALGALMGVMMLAGTWASRRFVMRLSPDRFRLIVTGLLALVAFEMIVVG